MSMEQRLVDRRNAAAQVAPVVEQAKRIAEDLPTPNAKRAFWAALQVGQRIVIQLKTDHSKLARWLIATAPVSHGTWVEIAVTPYATAVGYPIGGGANILVAVVGIGGDQFMSATDPSQFIDIPKNAANDAAAATAGVQVGGIYRNGSVLMVRVV